MIKKTTIFDIKLLYELLFYCFFIFNQVFKTQILKRFRTYYSMMWVLLSALFYDKASQQATHIASDPAVWFIYLSDLFFGYLNKLL